MKKSVLIGVLAIIIAGLSSCEQTKEVVQESQNWKIVDCYIGYSQWRYTGDDTGLKYDNNYYYVS